MLECPPGLWVAYMDVQMSLPFGSDLKGVFRMPLTGCPPLPFLLHWLFVSELVVSGSLLQTLPPPFAQELNRAPSVCCLVHVGPRLTSNWLPDLRSSGPQRSLCKWPSEVPLGPEVCMASRIFETCGYKGLADRIVSRCCRLILLHTHLLNANAAIIGAHSLCMNLPACKPTKHHVYHARADSSRM